MTFGHKIIRTVLPCLATLAVLFPANAQIDIHYRGGITINAGSNGLAPYYIASNRGGTVTQQASALLDARIWHDIDTAQRLSYGFGAEVWSGIASSVKYRRFQPATGSFADNSQHPARLWLQQLYAQGKYRSVFLTLGMKREASPILNNKLSSGDLIMSGNARPSAGFSSGLIDFQDIPLTHGWVQVAGALSYYKAADKAWLNNHYNFYNNFITTGYWTHYKRIHFRTRPSQPLVLTIGAQAASQFGGNRVKYEHGQVIETIKMPQNLKSFFHTIIAGGGGGDGDKQYVEGNHLGSWDIVLEYKLPQGRKLRAYYQTPWEDGSGIGKLNGFDGLWGIEFNNGGHNSIVKGAVLEYIDLTNQSGPIHWAPGDHPDLDGTHLANPSTGADNYYNNYAYNGYQSFGMSIGSPFVKSPIYNTNGYLAFADNLMRGFHMAVTGNLTPEVSYRAMLSYRKSWGTPMIPNIKPLHDTSFMLETSYRPQWLTQLLLKAQLAFDRGNLYSNNLGGLISISYHGNLNIKR